MLIMMEKNIYKFQFRSTNKRLKSFNNDKKTNRDFESTTRNIPWTIKILNTIDFITDEKLNEEDLTKEDLTKLVKKRNDFIHANPTTGDKVNISIDDLKFLNHIITIGLKNIV